MPKSYKDIMFGLHEAVLGGEKYKDKDNPNKRHSDRDLVAKQHWHQDSAEHQRDVAKRIKNPRPEDKYAFLPRDGEAPSTPEQHDRAAARHDRGRKTAMKMMSKGGKHAWSGPGGKIVDEAMLGGLKYKGKANPNIRHSLEDADDKVANHDADHEDHKVAQKKHFKVAQKHGLKAKRHAQAADAADRIVRKLDEEEVLLEAKLIKTHALGKHTAAVYTGSRKYTIKFHKNGKFVYETSAEKGHYNLDDAHNTALHHLKRLEKLNEDVELKEATLGGVVYKNRKNPNNVNWDHADPMKLFNKMHGNTDELAKVADKALHPKKTAIWLMHTKDRNKNGGY